MLSDPRQKRFFKSKDMRDLFTLGDEYAEATESAALFAGIAPGVSIDASPEPPGLSEGTPGFHLASMESCIRMNGSLIFVAVVEKEADGPSAV